MPYRPHKTTHASATRTDASPITGAWVHDRETGETAYTANPAAYLLDTRYRVLRGKKRPMMPSAKAEARKSQRMAKRRAGKPAKPVVSIVEYVRLQANDPGAAASLMAKQQIKQHDADTRAMLINPDASKAEPAISDEEKEILIFIRLMQRR